MDRAKRLELIDKIEGKTEARVLVYVLGDWRLGGAQIADDAVWPLHDHLRRMARAGPMKRIALFLYSVGGLSEAPWKIVSMIREYSDELYVIVPYRCYSAATMIALGADKIVMGRKGELGPIDPSMSIEGTPPKPLLLREVGVEDIASYVTFLRQRAGLTDQAAMASAVGILSEHLTPPLLGRIERVYSHSRLVARKLLSLHKPPIEDTKVTAIIEALTEKSYSHGHAIGRKEAQTLGLDVKEADSDLDAACWSLLEAYVGPLRLRETDDAMSFFPNDITNEHRMQHTVGIVESRELLHAFSGKLVLHRLRKMPPQLNLNVQLPLQLPANVQAGQLPAAIQQAIQVLLQQAAAQIAQIVEKEIARQAPVEGVHARLEGAAWQEVPEL